MPWCPDCHIEYDPGIAVCPDCGANIVAELPYIPLGPPPVVVYEANTATEAQIVKATLQTAGIAAFVQPSTAALPGQSITDDESPDLQVLVPPDRLVEASRFCASNWWRRRSWGGWRIIRPIRPFNILYRYAFLMDHSSNRCAAIWR
jgi:hypothetical protein